MNKQFDKLATIWCKNCGAGDSIVCKRILRREESFEVDDIDAPDSTLGEIHESVESTTYSCSVCGEENTDLSDIATGYQNEAIAAYDKYVDTMAVKDTLTTHRRIPKIQWSHNDEEYYPDYEED